jgi:DNA-binding SARP family transcriptional activator
VGKAVLKAGDADPERAKNRGRLEIRLFGHLTAALDGEPFDLATPRKSLQLLAYLWLHRTAPVGREYLAFLLYPDDEETAARAKLRATLSELPKILPKPLERYVSSKAEKIAWNPDADFWLDVDAFAAAANDRRRLDEAIALYRGDLLPEVYDEWLDVIRERHRNAFVRCLGERVSQARQNADLALAIETARKVLAIDPWREDMLRRIVAMRYDSGDRAGALREYAAFAQRLRDEMNAEPMPETAAVAERIARGEAPLPEGDDPGASAFGASGSRPASGTRPAATLPFVGRRGEMERLLAMWNRAAGGHGGACTFIGGESGIGKSRIARELTHAVEDRGGRVLIGATSSPEAVPYESVADALRSALPLLVSLKPGIALACVGALVPEIRARVKLPDLPRLDGESERIRLFESLFRCLADLASARPLLVVLEDLQWGQAGSIDLLEFLLRRISSVPVALVVTYRDEEAPRLHPLHRLRREARATAAAQSLHLGQLTVAEVEELRAALPEMRDHPVEALIAASHGNPLFLTQLVVEVREGRQADVPPMSLEAAVVRRIERLSDRARTAAEIAACIGDRFSRDAVREVSAWDEVALTNALDELLDRRIVREAGDRGVFEYAFAHQVVQNAIVRAVPPERAAVRRQRVARVLEELYPERSDELSAIVARHYELAGDAPNAARCYLQAARRSISLGALEEARLQCGAALSLAEAPRIRADLLLESETIESRRGDRDSWGAAIDALEVAGADLHDRALYRTTLLRRIVFACAGDDWAAHERAVGALRAAVSVPENDATDDTDTAQWQAAAALAESTLAFRVGRLAEAFAAAEAAAAYSRAAGDDAGTSRALCALAELEAHRGRLRAADELYDRAGSTAARGSDPALEQLSLRSGWSIAYQRRDIARCRMLAERWLELAVALGDRPAEAEAHGWVGVSLTAAGERYAQAREHFSAACTIFGENANAGGLAGALLNQAVLETRLGFFDRALAATERAAELFATTGNGRGRVAGLANLVLLRAFAGQLAGARAAADEALPLTRQLGFELQEASVFENLAFAEAAAGDLARAIELATSSFKLRAHSETQVWSSKTLADVAIWHASLGNLPAARDAVRRLLADDDAIARGTDWPSYCYWAAAQILRLDGGDEADAARALAHARRIVQTTADELDAGDRERFRAIPWHLDLARAAEHGIWPDPPR